MRRELRLGTVPGVRIGMLTGSHGSRSANTSILIAAAANIEAAGHAAVWVSGLEAVPFFRSEQADEPPDSVAAFRRQLREADAVLIAAPEYAAGLAGATKNALDWLVGDATLYRKVIGVASAGTTGGGFAIEQLVRTISWQGGYVVSVLGVEAPRTKTADDGAFNDPATLRGIARWVEVMVAALGGSAVQRRELLTLVVEQFGIDPARFGEIK
jgi:chromate reductase